MKSWKSLVLILALATWPMACGQGDMPLDTDTGGDPSQNSPNIPQETSDPTVSPEPSPTPDGGDNGDHHDHPPIYSADDPRFRPCQIGTPGCGDMHPELDQHQQPHQQYQQE